MSNGQAEEERERKDILRIESCTKSSIVHCANLLKMKLYRSVCSVVSTSLSSDAVKGITVARCHPRFSNNYQHPFAYFLFQLNYYWPLHRSIAAGRCRCGIWTRDFWKISCVKKEFGTRRSELFDRISRCAGSLYENVVLATFPAMWVHVFSDHVRVFPCIIWHGIYFFTILRLCMHIILFRILSRRFEVGIEFVKRKKIPSTVSHILSCPFLIYRHRPRKYRGMEGGSHLLWLLFNIAFGFPVWRRVRIVHKR